MSSHLLYSIFQTMNMVIFERKSHHCFIVHSDIPSWLEHRLVRSKNKEGYDLIRSFTFIEYFIADAEQQWEKQSSYFIDSGFWKESHNNTAIALEAKAAWLDGRPILLIGNAEKEYQSQFKYMQKSRENLLIKESLESEVIRRTQDTKRREEEIAIKLVSIAGFRDKETGAHIRRIGLYAAVMAKALGWSRSQVEDIRIAAPMHDIGKIGIPDSVLLKKGKLTTEEFEVMKRHTTIGANMLEGSDIPMMDMAADIALNHHERWDGTGYPRGISGTDIPEAARITTIVDVYDALVHKRIYKKAFSEEQALTLLSDSSGLHIDPILFEIFLEQLPNIRAIKDANQEELLAEEAEAAAAEAAAAEAAAAESSS